MRAALRLLGVAGALWVLAPPAQAFLGIGDITFDPSNHAELLSIYEQTLKTYELAQQELSKASQIAETLRRAQASVAAIKNTRLNTLAQQFVPGASVSGAQGLAKLSALQADLQQEQAAAGSNTSYYRAQINRIAALKRLFALQKAAAQGMTQSSTGLGEADSARVAAQSTATLAALATVQARHDEQSSVEAAAAGHRQQGFIGRTKQLYQAAAGTP